MQIQNAYLTHNRPKTRRSRTTAIAVHWVANPNSTAMANRNYFNTTSRAVSSNYIIGLQGKFCAGFPMRKPAGAQMKQILIRSVWSAAIRTGQAASREKPTPVWWN